MIFFEKIAFVYRGKVIIIKYYRFNPRCSSCSFSGPLFRSSPVVVFLDRGHPLFWNFNSTIPVDVIGVKSYVNSFLDLTCVPVRISINKLDVTPRNTDIKSETESSLAPFTDLLTNEFTAPVRNNMI